MPFLITICILLVLVLALPVFFVLGVYIRPLWTIPKVLGLLSTKRKYGKRVNLEKRSIWKWILPMCLAAMGWELQSIGLHYATYKYIHEYVMNNVTTPWAPQGNKTGDWGLDKHGHNITVNGQVATLWDVGFAINGQPAKDQFIHFIDAVSMAFPALFMALTLAAYLNVNPLEIVQSAGERVEAVVQRGVSAETREKKAVPRQETSGALFEGAKRHRFTLNVLQVWTKVMTCAAMLFTFKGIMGAITIEPDSSGWAVCQARLKDEGTRFMMQKHTFVEIMFLDENWVLSGHMGLVRYCSDMMYSGHTFAVCLFALGLYELIRMFQVANSRMSITKMVSLVLLSVVTIGEQCFEIYLMEGTQFHYTADVVMAIPITFLCYTNVAVVLFSKAWAEHGFHLSRWNRRRQTYQGSSKSSVQLDWEVEAAPIMGEDHKDMDIPALHREAWKVRPDRKPKEDNTPGCCTSGKTQTEELHFSDFMKELMAREDDDKEGPLLNTRKSWDMHVSKGDALIPWCCFPFCCFAGREHLYSDGMIFDLVERDKSMLQYTNELRHKVKKHTSDQASYKMLDHEKVPETRDKMSELYEHYEIAFKKYLDMTMCTNEGVSSQDLKRLPWVKEAIDRVAPKLVDMYKAADAKEKAKTAKKVGKQQPLLDP